MRAGVPFADGYVELHRGLPAGNYKIKLTSAFAPVLPALTITLEPFNLPEALQAGEAYLASRHYIRAAAVLSDAAARYAENADVQDLLVLAHTLAIADPAAYLKEESEFGVMRSRSDTVKQLRELLTSTKAKFGKRMASIFGARSLDRVAIPDEVIAKIAQETASVVVLKVMAALKEHLDAQEDTVKDQLLLQVLDGVTERLAEVEILRRDLSERIDLVRQDTLKSVDEKFGLVCEALERYENAVAQVPAATPDYAPFFRERLGEACWNWVGSNCQKMFIEAEDHYHRVMNKPNNKDANFTHGLLEYCRAFEFLLNKKLGGLCKSIQNTVSRDSVIYNLVLENLSSAEELELALAPGQTLNMTKIAALLHLGRILQVARPGTLSGHAAALLACSPGPADIDQIATFYYTAVKLRNGTIHKHSVTKIEKMRMLRKLGLGLDEERRVGHPHPVLNWINDNSWLEKEHAEASDRLAQNWPNLPGFVPMVWRALEGSATAPASTSAA